MAVAFCVRDSGVCGGGVIPALHPSSQPHQPGGDQRQAGVHEAREAGPQGQQTRSVACYNHTQTATQAPPHCSTSGLQSPFCDLQDSVSSLGVLTFQVSPSDYLLGVADLTGELMRLCISSVGNGDIDTPFQLSQFLRQIHDGFSYIGNTGPYEVSKKLHTLRQSLGKVEDACYTLRVRGSEIPKHMLADVFSSRSTLIDPDEGAVWVGTVDDLWQTVGLTSNEPHRCYYFNFLCWAPVERCVWASAVIVLCLSLFCRWICILISPQRFSKNPGLKAFICYT